MGQADWAELGGALDIADLNRGVTAGIDRPNGGGSYVYGYNSLDGTVTGAAGMFVNLSGFKPTGSLLSVPDGGCSVRGCVKRVTSPNKLGFSPVLFACAQGDTVNDTAYMMGLSDDDPYEIVLAKGPIVGGAVGADSNAAILARSSAQYNMADGIWHHLRMDCIVQPNGDVLIRGFTNNLATHPVGGSALWNAVTGWPVGGFIDDRLHIASGSAPLWGGWCGFAFAVANQLNARGAFDALEAYRVVV